MNDPPEAPAPTAPTPSQVAPAAPAVDEELVAASIPDASDAYWVTPEVAALWLSRNNRNRPLREGRIVSMARDMRSGDWHYTGEAVKFTPEGRLIDGQHRLSAVVRSGATVKMHVVLDVPDAAQAFMDSGAKRTAGDALAFRGETNASMLASTIRFAILFEARQIAGSGRDTVSHAEIIEWLTDHPDIRQHVSRTAKCYGKIDMKPSVFTYVMWKLWAIDAHDAEAFYTDIVEMRSTGAGDPIHTLLQRYRTARKNRETLSAVTELAFLFRTWNAYRSGAVLKILKVPTDDADVVMPK